MMIRESSRDSVFLERRYVSLVMMVCFSSPPASIFPITIVPMSRYLSMIGILSDLSAPIRSTAGKPSKYSRRQGPSYQLHTFGPGASFKNAPVKPEQGMNWMSFLGLKPHFLKNGVNCCLISSYRD